ncbi:hypothetical protein PybrP1_010144 [[Pythium] brassicae (nom. inval.)]|nr:hypothetical protein PybrP1_010144 [[Pythium] brassicae (nom. inval.)]
MVSSDFLVKKESVTLLVRAVRSLNVVTAAIQLLSGAGSLTSLLFLNVPATLVAIYVVLFALLLLLFECRLRATDAFLRRYFGFLFTYRGLGGFLLMVGILDLGMEGGLFGLVAGCTACVNALIVFFVGCCAPRVSESGSSSCNNNNNDHQPASINHVSMPSYGSSAASKTASNDDHVAIPVAAIAAAAVVASGNSGGKGKKQSGGKSKRKSGSSLLNTTLNP